MNFAVYFAAMIRDKIIDNKFSSFLIETGELGVIEVEVNSRFNNKVVEDVNIKSEFLIVSVIKPDKTVLIPEPKTLLEEGDRIVAVLRTKNLDSIKKALRLTEE